MIQDGGPSFGTCGEDYKYGSECVMYKFLQLEVSPVAAVSSLGSRSLHAVEFRHLIVPIGSV